MTRASDPVLLLHGQPGGARDWDRVRAAIGGRDQTLAFDRPGWDGRSRPRGLEGNAAAAVATLDGAGAERATVAGHSLGGAVAAWLAATHPQRVSRLVLVAPAANTQSLVPLDYVLAAPLVGELASAASLVTAGAALAARPLRRLISSGLAMDTSYLDASSRRLLTPATWGSFVAEQRMLIRELPQLEPLLGRISAPTTIVFGTADRLVPPASARRLADQIPNAQLVQIDGASHLLPQQHPRRVAEVITGSGLD